MDVMLSSAKKYRDTTLVSALLLTLLGFGVRLYDLGNDSFWFDEVLTVTTAQRGIAAIMTETRHPPLHYLFVSAALSLFGENEFAARLPSLLAGTLAVPLLIMWGKDMKRPSTGLWAALLLALSPFHLRYSQEARHYAWLTLFSLATYVLLYRAMTRRQWRWWLLFAVFTAANLYTHYAALVVLASQTIMIGGWIWSQWRQRGYRTLIPPAAAAATVLLLYLLQLPKLLNALSWNLGPGAGRGGSIVSPSLWIREAFFAFSPVIGVFPYLMAALALMGMWQLSRKSQRHLLLLVGGGIVLPIVLLGAFQVSRWAFAKYIIYILPLYLVAIGAGLAAVFEYGQRYWGEHGRYLAPVLVLVITLISWKPLQAEYQYIERDWLGVVDTLRHNADEDDVIISLSLDSPIGFNAGKLMLPYYLARENVAQTALAMQSFGMGIVDELSRTGTTFRALVQNQRTPMVFDADVLSVKPYQGSLYLLEVADTSKSVLEQLIYLYEQLIPLAGQPVPQCLLREDLAFLHIQKRDFLTANQLLTTAQETCPELVNGRYSSYDMLSEIHQGLMDYYQQQGDLPAARQEAFQLLAIDTKNAQALEMVTAVNLLQQFKNNNATINAAPDVEPIQIRQFTMPHNGDWGEVLLIHPPNSLSLPVQLPDEAVDLYFRAAMAPESWGWGGDGSTFVVSVARETEPAAELFRQHISNNPSDQDWHKITIPLAEYAGQKIILTLAAEPGPAGDFTGDWAGWETPRIIYHAGSQIQN